MKTELLREKIIKKILIYLQLLVIVMLLVLASCNGFSIQQQTPTQTETSSISAIKPSPTPTPTLVGALSPDQPELPQKLTGELEVRFPHPFGGTPEFCASFVLYQLDLVTGTYQLTGEGKFDCLQSETLEAGIIQYLEQHYDVILSGSMDTAPGSILKMDLLMVGFQDGYFDMPPDVPETITVSNPFHVEIDQPLSMQFNYEDEANCLWNKNGMFCSVEGEEGLLEESGWLFILHPDS